KAEQLVARLETTKTRAERQPVVAELGHALATHMEVEERRVYPMIEEHLGEDKATGAEAEHDKARDGLAKLTEGIDQPAFGAGRGFERILQPRYIYNGEAEPLMRYATARVIGIASRFASVAGRPQPLRTTRVLATSGVR